MTASPRTAAARDAARAAQFSYARHRIQAEHWPCSSGGRDCEDARRLNADAEAAYRYVAAVREQELAERRRRVRLVVA